jgi:dTDP-4-dehydrorhamnose reductase
MNILLLGHRGYLGGFLKDKFSFDVVPRAVKYDYVINCIGKPSLEFCEQSPDVSYVSNFAALKEAIERHKDSKFIHFSSYYVYDDSGLCSEDSNTTTRYKYCEHKLMSEAATVQSGGVVFRLGKIFGPSIGKEQKKLTEVLLFSDQVTLDDVRFNPVSLWQIERTIQHEFSSRSMTGIYNLSNKGVVSHYDYGRFIRDNFNSDLKIHRVEKHSRSFHNYGRFSMSCKKIEKEIPLLTWQEDMLKYIEVVKCIV